MDINCDSYVVKEPEVVIGHIIIPGGKGIEMKEEFYDIRYNHSKGHMSNQKLGLQVIVKFLNMFYVWINIDKEWICEKDIEIPDENI